MSTIKANTLLHSDGSTTNPPAIPALDQRMAKAWVNFNGTVAGSVSGTVAINSAYNVSSITDNATGDYTITFTTAMANANYSITGMARHNLGIITFYNGGLTTTVARVITYDSTTQADRNACVTVFGT
tara:strand:+ start:367 stop:750 length:384 start_codon:yes stop_codon:yes gene_type:complete